MSKQYNLRSTKPDSIQLPVQVQLCDDGEFMTHLLSTGSETLHDKQMGHDSSSESELDCSAIVGASDSDNSSTPGGRAFNRLHSEQAPSTSSSSDQVAQTLVNQKILEQLTSIGKRLDALENNKCKKSSDKSKIKNKKAKVGHKVPLSAHAQSVDTVGLQNASTVPSVIDTQTNTHALPSLSSIRQNANIQQQVDQRIHELSLLAKTGTDAKLKSQRGGQLKFTLKIKSNGPMSTFWPE